MSAREEFQRAPTTQPFWEERGTSDTLLRILDLIEPGDLVLYHGSITNRHGLYLAQSCDCFYCARADYLGSDDVRYRLTDPYADDLAVDSLRSDHSQFLVGRRRWRTVFLCGLAVLVRLIPAGHAGGAGSIRGAVVRLCPAPLRTPCGRRARGGRPELRRSRGASPPAGSPAAVRPGAAPWGAQLPFSPGAGR